MSTAEIKEKLQSYIEQGDDRLLKLMLALAKEYMDESDGYLLSKEELRLLEEDDAAYERGEGKNYTAEEALEIMRKGFPREK